MQLDSKIPEGTLAEKWDKCRFANKLINPANKRKYEIIIVGTGLAALFLHISHGFWSLLQTLGISHPKYDRPLRVIAWALAGCMAAVFVLVTLRVLFAPFDKVCPI